MTLFLQHITEEAAAMVQFQEVLDHEQDVLAHGRFDELPALTAFKSDLADKIILLDRQRETLQKENGFASGQAGATAFALQSGPEAETMWKQLIEMAQKAKEANHRNGVMIHMHLDFTRQSIQVLHNGSHAPSVYGRDGIQRVGRGGNCLASS